MIGKKELLELAKLMGMRPWQQEKHYIQANVLYILSEMDIVFKGGTCLWFFHRLQRFSEDLDFTAQEKPGQSISETVSRNLRLIGIENNIKPIKDNEQGLSFRISSKGPLYTGTEDLCHVYVEISAREKISMPVAAHTLDFPGYGLQVRLIKGMNPDEIGAEKIRAIMTRNKGRDLYDLWHLISKMQINFNLSVVDKKLGFYSKKYSFSELDSAIKRKKGIYDKEVPQLVFEKAPSFEECKKTIESWAGLQTRT